MHCDFACMLYGMLKNKLTDAELHAIVGEAVVLEKEFVCEALPVSLIGMNATLMSQYIEFCADRLLVALDAAKLYHAANPFDWMGERGRRLQPSSPIPPHPDNATPCLHRAHFVARENVRALVEPPLERYSYTLTASPVRFRNFFERRVSEYQKAGVMSSVANNNSSNDIMNTNEFSLEADF